MAGTLPTPVAYTDTLAGMVYDQLRALAHRYVQGERETATMAPTALVHEAYLRLARGGRRLWQGRTHFFAVAALEMRRVLVDRARALHARKRGEGLILVTLDEESAPAGWIPTDLIALDQALDRLAALSPRQARVAELRAFAGMSVDEVARALGVSERTVKKDWLVARLWLSRELRPPGPRP